MKGFSGSAPSTTGVLSPTSSLFSMSPGVNGDKSNIGAFFQTCKVKEKKITEDQEYKVMGDDFRFDPQCN